MISLEGMVVLFGGYTWYDLPGGMVVLFGGYGACSWGVW